MLRFFSKIFRTRNAGIKGVSISPLINANANDNATSNGCDVDASPKVDIVFSLSSLEEEEEEEEELFPLSSIPKINSQRRAADRVNTSAANCNGDIIDKGCDNGS